jgi:membrane protease YdiL (CAAX protease family)
LQAEEQVAAEQAFNSLAIVGGLPALGCFAGVSVLLFVVGQWLVRRKQALLSLSGMAAWSTPWDAEAILQVFVGFFIVSPLIALTLHSLIQILGINLMEQGWRATALFYLINYVLVAAGSLTILYLCIKPFLPLPEGWFRFTLRGNWLWWGLGSYFAALPLVIAISFLNQKIWQGQGGSNEILRIVFQGKDNVALAIFFVTATIAAPIFEEILFRGFLLPSLTRYLPVWGAIALSGFVFAMAHLSLSEVLPLTVLGMVLGFVYTRSRNLLASMLLHCLWNSGTLLSLFILGGSAR